MKRSTAGLVLTLLMILLISISVRGPQPPDVVPAGAPADRFSAERAREHLHAIAQKPHAMGTEEHARVRQYIVDELEALGMTVELQDTVTPYGEGDRRSLLARVINVLARLEGSESGPALLLMSHYDTVTTSPGAGDDSSGVAVMLETLRALKAGPEPRNDILFLFTDGEEAGLLGAQAFASQHPASSEVAMVVNFEARGSRGPALMFETSFGNAPLIRAFEEAVPHPAAASYSYEVYRRMPNDTDFSVFRRGGRKVSGFNFAFIGGGTAYHSAQDSLEKLDLRSVQHMGDAALGLARHFGDADLQGDWQTRDAVYFNPLGTVLLGYSGAFALPLAVLLAIAALVLLVWGFRRGRLQVGRFLLSFLAVLLGTAGVGYLLLTLAGAAMTNYNFVLWNGWTSTSLSFLGLGFLAAAINTLLFALLRARLGAENLFAAGLLLWLLLTALISAVAPGASYLFALPLAVALASGMLWFQKPPDDDPEASLSGRLVLVLGLSMVVIVLLWSPMMGLLATALGRTAAVVLGAFFFLLVCGPLAPSFDIMAPQRGSWRLLAPAVLVVCGVIVTGAVRAGSKHDAENRRMNSIFYYLDTEAAEARWISYDAAPDRWTAQFLGESPELKPRPPVIISSAPPVLTADAPVAPLEGGRVEWLGAEAHDDGYAVDLRILWPYDVHRAVFYFRSEADVVAVSSEGRSTLLQEERREGDDGERFMFYAPPQEGLSLRVELEREASFEIDIVAHRYQLPEIDGMSYQPRGEDTMPRYGWTIDSTLVRSVARWTPGMEIPEPQSGEETADEEGGAGLS